MVLLHSHALARAFERGTTEQEIVDVVETGERFPAKHEREGFRKTFIYNDVWQGVHYYVKQIECYAVQEKGNWLVISLLVKYF